MMGELLQKAVDETYDLLELRKFITTKYQAELIRELGFEYILDVLGQDENSELIKDLRALLALVSKYKGTEDGFQLINELINLKANIVIWYNNGRSDSIPMTYDAHFDIDHLYDTSRTRQVAYDFITFLRNYVMPILNQLEFIVSVTMNPLWIGANGTPEKTVFSDGITAEMPPAPGHYGTGQDTFYIGGVAKSARPQNSVSTNPFSMDSTPITVSFTSVGYDLVDGGELVPVYVRLSSPALGGERVDFKTKDGTASSVSPKASATVLAIDEFNNPFITVYDDGTARAYYDGGFPKFYSNQYDYTWGSDYSKLNNDFKMLANAIIWTSERKTKGDVCLFITDEKAGGEYDLDKFKDAMSGTIAAAGLTPKLVSLGDLSNQLVILNDGQPLSTEYLSEYVKCIIVMSSHWSTSMLNDPLTLKTELAVRINEFGEMGGGVCIITDHAELDASAGFQMSANKVAKYFGAQFYGDIDRHPVEYSSLPAVARNHPVLNNISSGTIKGGGSEGNIQVRGESEYDSKSGTIVFAPGEQEKMVTIQSHVLLGTQNKFFYVDLLNPVGCLLGSTPRTIANIATGAANVSV